MARPKGSKNKAKSPTKKKAAAPKPKAAADEKIKGKKASAPDTGPLAGTAHNLKKVRLLIEPFYERYSNIMTSQQSDNASHNASKRDLFEDAANDLGTKKRLVRQALAEKWRFVQQQAKEEEMERDEVEHLDTMREALGLYGDTPLGQAAMKNAEKKAEASKNAATNGKGGDKVVSMPERATTGAEMAAEEAQTAA